MSVFLDAHQIESFEVTRQYLLEEAEKSALSITDKAKQSQAFASVGKAYAKCSNTTKASDCYKKALEALSESELYPSSRRERQLKLIKALAKIGEIDEATIALPSTDDPEGHTMGVQVIALVQANEREYISAIATAGSNEETLHYIALIMIKHGNSDAIEPLLSKISNVEYLNSVIIAREIARGVQVNQLFQRFTGHQKSTALGETAKSQHRIKDFDGVRKTAALMDEKSQAFHGIPYMLHPPRKKKLDADEETRVKIEMLTAAAAFLFTTPPQ